VGFKIGSDDTTNTPARVVARELRLRGANPCFLDSRVGAFVVDGVPLNRVDTGDLAKTHFDAGLILAGDATAQAPDLERAVDVLLDAGGGRILCGELELAKRL
jgi:hypothetical protein